MHVLASGITVVSIILTWTAQARRCTSHTYLSGARCIACACKWRRLVDLYIRVRYHSRVGCVIGDATAR